MQFELKGHPLLELLGFAPVRITDARGQRVPLLKQNAAPSPEVRRTMARSIPATHWGRVALILACVGFSSYFSGGAVLAFVDTGQIGPNKYALLTLFFMALTVLLVIIEARLAYGSNMAARLVDAGYCASCGYSIDDITPTNDGCKTCPECAATWHTQGPAPHPTHRDPRKPSRMYRLGRWVRSRM